MRTASGARAGGISGEIITHRNAGPQRNVTQSTAYVETGCRQGSTDSLCASCPYPECTATYSRMFKVLNGRKHRGV